MDGSLCPCWSWADAPELRSGKHKTTGHSHQFVCDLDGELMHVSDPLPGKTHDAKAIVELGLTDILRGDNSIADKGSIGTGPTTPFRKPAGGELVNWQNEFNTEINKIRYVIEHAIANFKTWRCMFTDYRRPLHTYKTSVPRRFERSTSSNCVLHEPQCIGYAIADHMRAELVVDALRMAARNFCLEPKAIFHTDRGSQYFIHEFAEVVDQLDVRHSVGRVRIMFR